ncbi:protein DMP10-like [Rosa sericea]
MTTATQHENVSATQKTIASAANLANLLPTGTILAFETLIPSFSNNGACHPANKGLSSSIILICALICFFSSFTDSFIDSTDGKFYYGIATSTGIRILNPRTKMITYEERKRLEKYKITGRDYFHAFLTLTVFLVFALTDLNVKNCFFPDAGDDLNQIIINLPLGAGIFASFLFTIFPTTRRGIGYTQPRPNKEEKDGNQTSAITTASKGSEAEMVGVVVEGAVQAEAQVSATASTPPR